VPAAPVVAGRERVADPAFHLDPEDEGVQQRRAGDRPPFGEREQAGRDRRCRMDHRAQMRVVEVEHVGAHRIEERRGERVGAFAPADDGRLRRAETIGECREQNLHRFVAAAAERGGEEIDERALGFVPHSLGHVFGAVRGEEPRQLFGDLHGS